MKRLRAHGSVALLGVVAVACGPLANDGDSVDAGDDGDAVAVEQMASSPREDTASALENPTADGLPSPLIDPNELLAGGPPPDGIPAIDEPKFVRASSATFLEDDEPVLAIELDGEARAYPIQIMTWHEIVNDTIAGRPVTVSYCPLCNSAIAYDRRLGDRVLDFGTSGMLYQSALVMYDRQTESLWSHFTGEAVIGTLTGEELDLIPMSTVSWSDWLDANPDGLVLSRDTGHRRSYGENPYPGYDDVDDPPFLFEGETDGRLAAKERVVGIRGEDDAIAIRTADLFEARVVEIEVGGRPVVVWLEPGTASALDELSVGGGRDVGATGVFEPTLDGRRLTFEPRKGGFRDTETGSTWDVLGNATGGPLAGSKLIPVEHVDTFWFAWAAFLPDTRIAGI
ncbi:MAG: DUF3179 domain-containing protein [Acidimicrobiia bacterium]